MIATLNELCNYLPYLYVVMFLLCIATSKKLTSLSITIILIACAEFIIDAVAPPLSAISSDRTLEYVVRVSVWTGFWTFSYMIIGIVLHKSHDWLNLVKGRAVKQVHYLLAGLAALEWLGYVNAFFIKQEFIKTLYALGIPALGLLLGVYLFIELGLSIKDKYVNRTNLTYRGTQH